MIKVFHMINGNIFVANVLESNKIQNPIAVALGKDVRLMQVTEFSSDGIMEFHSHAVMFEYEAPEGQIKEQYKMLEKKIREKRSKIIMPNTDIVKP